MTHEDIKILISAYSDGEVTPSEKDIVENHLSSCASCQKDLQMYKTMSSSLSKWPNEALSPDESIKVQKGFEQRRESMFSTTNLMALGTALALTVVIGTVVYPRLHAPNQMLALKSAADDVGDQYSDAGASALQQKEAQPAVFRMAKASPVMFGGGMMANKKLESRLMMNDSLMATDPMAAASASGQMQGSAFGNNLVATSYAPAQPDYGRKIIRNASIALKVDDAQKTQSILEGLVSRYNGTVNSLNIQKSDDGSRNGVMVISVPPQSLDSVLAEIRKLGEIDSESQSGSDVTNQYAYLQARLQSFEAQRQRLQKDLKKSGNDVDNNVYIEGQISNIEENMNALQGNLKDLDQQSFMATVTVNFYDTASSSIPKAESIKDKTIGSFKDDVNATLVMCYRIAVNSFSGIVIVLSFLVQLGVWALLCWGIYFIIRRFFK